MGDEERPDHAEVGNRENRREYDQRPSNPGRRITQSHCEGVSQHGTEEEQLSPSEWPQGGIGVLRSKQHPHPEDQSDADPGGQKPSDYACSVIQGALPLFEL